MQYAVKFSEVGIGLLMLFIAFFGNRISSSKRINLFVIGNLAIIAVMVVAIYTHLHPDVPAEILPLEYKTPVMGITYIVLAILNLNLNKKKINTMHKHHI